MQRFVELPEASNLFGGDAKKVKDAVKKGWVKQRNNQDTALYCLDDIRRLLAIDDGEKLAMPSLPRLPHQAEALKSVELFAGCGGTALGFEAAGFEPLILSEIDKESCCTLRANRPCWNVVEGDVAEIDFRPFRGKVDLLQGGVPCQAFSYAGKKMGFGDTRGTLFYEFARAIAECEPRAIAMENVKGLLTHDKGRTLSTMLGVLNELGYNVAARVLRAQFLGVPQKRERLFIIGFRFDERIAEIMFPREDVLLRTVDEALADCPVSEGETYSESRAAVLSMVPEGGNWKDLPDSVLASYMGGIAVSGGMTGFARRLAGNRPSPTLTCHPAQKMTERCHPRETRPLAVREYARIQAFPDDWAFVGKKSAKYRQIGNAVPPMMAFRVGDCVREQLCEKHLTYSD